MKINSKIILKSFLLLTFISLCFSFSALASNAQQNSQTYKYLYIKPKNIIDFVKEINELGKKGYQLKSVERYTRFAKNEDYYDVNIAGIVELHEGDFFEYDWFKFINLNELKENIALLGNRGFYFSQQIPYSLLPEDDNAEPGSLKKSVQIIADNYAPNEKDGNMFILERKNKLDEPIEFTFATPKPRTSIFGTSVTTKRNDRRYRTIS